MKVAYVVQKRMKLHGQFYERGDVIPDDVVAQWRTIRSFLGRDVIVVPAEDVPEPTPEPEPVVEIEELSESEDVDEIRLWLESQGVEVSQNGWCVLPDGTKVQGYTKAVEMLDEMDT